MRMCDLAQALRLSPSGLTRRLDGLVRHGLVERRSSPTDRRVMHAHLTDAGFERMMRRRSGPRRQRAPPPARPARRRAGRRAAATSSRRGKRLAANEHGRRLTARRLQPDRGYRRSAPGVPRPRRQRRHQGRHRRLHRRRRRRPVRRRRRCSPAARSPARAWWSAGATSPTARRVPWWSCRRTPTWRPAPQGLADAEELAAGVAARLGCLPDDVLVASTGVIGRPYPMDRVRSGIDAVATPCRIDDADAVAPGDHDHRHRAKVATRDGRRLGGARSSVWPRAWG